MKRIEGRKRRVDVKFFCRIISFKGGEEFREEQIKGVWGGARQGRVFRVVGSGVFYDCYVYVGLV